MTTQRCSNFTRSRRLYLSERRSVPLLIHASEERRSLVLGGTATLPGRSWIANCGACVVHQLLLIVGYVVSGQRTRSHRHQRLLAIRATCHSCTFRGAVDLIQLHPNNKQVQRQLRQVSFLGTSGVRSRTSET